MLVGGVEYVLPRAERRPVLRDGIESEDSERVIIGCEENLPLLQFCKNDSIDGTGPNWFWKSKWVSLNE